MQRSIAVALLLLVISLGHIVGSTETSSQEISIEQEDGLHVTNGTLYLSGTSNIALNNATWNLFNFSDDNQNLAVITSGDYLTQVAPISEGMWEWVLEVNVTELDCTCFLSVGVYDTYSTIYLFLGETNHRPLLLSIDGENQVTTTTDVEFGLDIILTPSHAGEILTQTNLCHSASNFMNCLEDPIIATTSVQESEGLYKLILNLSVNNVHEGNWILSTKIMNSLLVQSNPVSTGFNYDLTPPRVNLSMRDGITEGELVEIYANAEDGQNSGDLTYIWSYSSPGQEYRGISPQESSSSVSIYPETAGSWSVRVEVRDEAGWANTSEISFNVTNYLPVAKLTIDSLIIENGSTIKVNPDTNWVISASECFDTNNDQDDLTYYWRFTSPQGTNIYTGVEVNSDLEFEYDLYEVQFIVYDDDSASSTIDFEIDFREDIPLNSVPFYAKIILIVTLIFGSLILLRYSTNAINREGNEKIPKWKPKK